MLFHAYRLLGISLFLLLGIQSSPILAQEIEEERFAMMEDDEEDRPLDCSRESLLSFFPKPIVFKVLKSYGIPKDKWEPIFRDLQQKDKNMLRIVEDKAAQMDPNPLKDVKHRSQAVKLFRDALAESFFSVMNKYGVKDPQQNEKMLQDIQIEKARAFAECLERGS